MLGKIIALGIGGFIGSNLRYWLSYLFQHFFGDSFPLGTLFVNILGCFILGFITIHSETLGLNSNAKLFLGTGMLGALTTFSTFSYETLNLLNNSNYRLAFINITLNLVIGLLGVWSGFEVAKKFS